jgi:hypothetical protein
MTKAAALLGLPRCCSPPPPSAAIAAVRAQGYTVEGEAKRKP